MTDEIESVSVMEADSVTLHTNIVIQTDDLIEWRFGAQLDLIAKLNREANKISLNNDTGGRFTDRLKLDDQTGDLTIIDVRSELDGVYQLEITGKKVFTKTFGVSKYLNVYVVLVINNVNTSINKNHGVKSEKVSIVFRLYTCMCFKLTY